MEGIDKNTFKRIFYDHWDAFKQTHPRFDSPSYNDTIRKMLRENVSDPVVEKDIDRAWKDYPKGLVAFLQPGNVRYQKIREHLAKIIPANIPADPRGYRVLPKKPFQQRFFDSFGKDPLVCPKCNNEMSLELIYHPKYGTIKKFLLFEELPDERQTVGTAARRTIHRTERLVQVSLPFL